MSSPRINRARFSAAVSRFRLPGFLCLASIAVPLALQAVPPGWWFDRGVIDQTQAPNDYAVINQGQLKRFAKTAMLEMDAHLPGGAGAFVHAKIDAWATPSAATNDYAAVNLGELKTLAKPFYDQLIRVGYSGAYPWVGLQDIADDYAAANIGQVKNLFAFDLTTAYPWNDLNGDGIADWWAKYYFPPAGEVDPDSLSAGNADLTVLEKFQLGSNPYESGPYNNGPDGNPTPVIPPFQPSFLPEPQYAVVDLGAGTYPFIVNNKAQILLGDYSSGTVAWKLWTAGAREDLPVHGTLNWYSSLNNQGRALESNVPGTAYNVPGTSINAGGIYFYDAPVIWPPVDQPNKLYPPGYPEIPMVPKYMSPDRLGYMGTVGDWLDDDTLDAADHITSPGTVYAKGMTWYGGLSYFFWSGSGRGEVLSGWAWGSPVVGPQGALDPYGDTYPPVVEPGQSVTSTIPVAHGTSGPGVTYNAEYEGTLVNGIRGVQYKTNTAKFEYSGKVVDGVQPPEWILACAVVGNPGKATLIGSENKTGGKLFALEQTKVGNADPVWRRKSMNISGVAAGLNPRGEILVMDDDGDNSLWRNGTLHSASDLLPVSRGWSNLELNDMNDSGAIVGTADDTAGNTHGVLLLPVELSVTDEPNDLEYPFGWIAPETLYSRTFHVSAKVTGVQGLSMTTNILQDIQTNLYIKYDDGSYSLYRAPNYLADDNPRNPVVIATDKQGVITLKLSDQPVFPIRDDGRHFVTTLYRNSPDVRDFLTITVGTGTLQCVAEVNWSEMVKAVFDSAEPDRTIYGGSTGEFFPEVGNTSYGKTPKDSFSPNRGNLANKHVSVHSNWSAKGPPDSFAVLHPCPLPTPTPTPTQ